MRYEIECRAVGAMGSYTVDAESPAQAEAQAKEEFQRDHEGAGAFLIPSYDEIEIRFVSP